MSDTVLQVRMLGKFTLTYGDKELNCNSNRSRVTWNILAYLLCHRGEVISTDELMAAVWKQDKNNNPSGAMRTAIHRARSVVSELTEDSSCQYLVSKNGGYMWNPDVDIVMDIEVFDRLAAAVQMSADEVDVQSCMDALELYGGKFLPAQSSEMWVMPLQAYYHNLYEQLIDTIVPVLEREGRSEEGIAVCNKALRIDPYCEKFYQHLMRFLLVADERAEVIKVYEEMSKLLLDNFGIMPDQESRALYREALHSIRKGDALSIGVLQEQLCEQGEIKGALICDYDFFIMLYQAQARAIVRNGLVIHTALLTLKSRNRREVSPKSISLAMEHLETHLSKSLRKGDVITRCSSSQFLLMLSSANYENSCKVCQRFISSFEKKYPHSPLYIDYSVQPIVPSTRS